MSFDDTAELFREVGTGKAAAVARIVHFRPELARARDEHGVSVLEFARYMGQHAILAALIAAGPPLTVVEAVAINDAVALRQILAADRAVAGVFGSNGAAPLHVAAASDSTESIGILFEHGANVDVRTKDGKDRTPLHVSVARGHVAATRALLHCGADPNARDGEGVTPLMLAGAGNQRDIVELLIARNANFDLRNDRGETAADVGAAHGNAELAARLRLGERVVDRTRM